MQRNPHSYQIATGYRTFYSLSLIYQLITKKRLFFYNKVSDVEQYDPWSDVRKVAHVVDDTLDITFRRSVILRFNNENH